MPDIEQVYVGSVNARRVDLEFGAELQGIAFRAWSVELPEREVRHQFNTKIEHVVAVNKIYREHARQDGLIVAFDSEAERPVGFALAASDVSGNLFQRTYKKHFRTDKVYAWIRHVCVDPSWQGKGVGRSLVSEGLGEFRPEQIPTAYIYEENKVALAAAARLGFEKSPPDQKPQILEGYFGEDSEPVRQYRFAAPSVAAVIEAARS